MGFIFGSGDSSNAEADAITQSSTAQASSDREAARGSELQMESMVAQDKASRAAADILSRPQGTPTVDLSHRPGADINKRREYTSLTLAQPKPTPGGGGIGHGGGGGGGGGWPGFPGGGGFPGLPGKDHSPGPIRQGRGSHLGGHGMGGSGIGLGGIGTPATPAPSPGTPAPSSGGAPTSGTSKRQKFAIQSKTAAATAPRIQLK